MERNALKTEVGGRGQVAQLGAVGVGGLAATTAATSGRQTAAAGDGRPRQVGHASPAFAQLPHPQPVDQRIQRALDVRQQVHVVDERRAAEVGAGRRVQRQHLEDDERHEERVQGQQKDVLKVNRRKTESS